jgi:hypothetical protein
MDDFLANLLLILRIKGLIGRIRGRFEYRISQYRIAVFRVRICGWFERINGLIGRIWGSPDSRYGSIGRINGLGLSVSRISTMSNLIMKETFYNNAHRKIVSNTID